MQALTGPKPQVKQITLFTIPGNGPGKMWKVSINFEQWHRLAHESQ